MWLVGGIQHNAQWRHCDDLASSGIARAFPGGRVPHPEAQNEEENK